MPGPFHLFYYVLFILFLFYYSFCRFVDYISKNVVVIHFSLVLVVLSTFTSLQVISKNSQFFSLPRNSPVTYHTSILEDERQYVMSLRDCCSVLFAFQRINSQDTLFVEETRRWLSDSIAILLRFATLEDHRFILNHVLRCPRGIANWAITFVQVSFYLHSHIHVLFVSIVSH